jgi:hypothetical protein
MWFKHDLQAEAVGKLNDMPEALLPGSPTIIFRENLIGISVCLVPCRYNLNPFCASELSKDSEGLFRFRPTILFRNPSWEGHSFLEKGIFRESM